MSDDRLRLRLQKAADELDALAEVLGGGGGKLVGSAPMIFGGAAAGAVELRSAAGLVAHRAACWDALVAVRDGSNPKDDTTEIAGHRMPFEYARFLTTQAYLAATWSLADLVTRASARVLCIKAPLSNTRRTPNLWQHFLRDGDSAPWLTVNVLQECYAWPIAISYIVRNHFAHEGGVADGVSFFDGPQVTGGFTVSEAAWAAVLKKAKEYKVQPGQTRGGGIDPKENRRLDEILEACHEEMDDALGILARSAAALAGAYAALMHE